MYSHGSSGHAEYLYLFPDTCTHTVHQDIQSICIYFLIHVLIQLIRTCGVSVSISWYMYSYSSSGHTEYLYLFPDTCTHTVHQDIQSICIYFLIHVLTQLTGSTLRVNESDSSQQWKRSGWETLPLAPIQTMCEVTNRSGSVHPETEVRALGGFPLTKLMSALMPGGRSIGSTDLRPWRLARWPMRSLKKTTTYTHVLCQVICLPWP